MNAEGSGLMKGQLGSVTAGQEGQQRSLSLRYLCFPESLSADPYRNSVLFKRALGVQSLPLKNLCSMSSLPPLWWEQAPWPLLSGAGDPRPLFSPCSFPSP